MGKVTIHPATTVKPITLIGEMAGICWGANTSDASKNRNRGWDCIKSRHGRTWEFPEVYMVLDHYSARVIREVYTHIGGAPTRLQASTRYINYEEFPYVTPRSVLKNSEAQEVYDSVMENISVEMGHLEECGIPREDIAMMLPLAMESKVVIKMNLRTLLSMAQQRLCARAYWEFRQLMIDIKMALCNYSPEWEDLIVESGLYEPKCEVENGVCHERYSCGRCPTVEQLKARACDCSCENKDK